ncbi:MAG TPA: hypothetical protein VGN36_03405 [Sphingorhabdus sp.]|jgi:hypothetical protein|nr:hypothetical protein [Sphingorhabdus sp.]
MWIDFMMFLLDFFAALPAWGEIDFGLVPELSLWLVEIGVVLQGNQRVAAISVAAVAPMPQFHRCNPLPARAADIRMLLICRFRRAFIGLKRKIRGDRR